MGWSNVYMKKMLVTLTIQTELEYDDTDPEAYQEKLELLIQELEELEMSVDVEAEEPAGTTDDY